MNGKRWLAVAVAILVCIGAGVRYWSLNTAYPPAEDKPYGVGEEVEFGDFTLRVNARSFLKEADKADVLKEEMESGLSPQLLLLNVTIANRGEKTGQADLSSLILESGAWKNGIHLLAFLRVNENGEQTPSLSPELAPGEEQTVQLPFMLSPEQFKESQWPQVQERAYDLVLSLYPQKVHIVC